MTTSTTEAPPPSQVVVFLDGFKNKIRALPADALHPQLRAILLDYLAPTLEAQQEEYLGGFAAMEERLEDAEEQLDAPDMAVLKLALQAIAQLGTLADMVLQRAGWVDAAGNPVTECPDDIKVAYGAAKGLSSAVAAQIKEGDFDDDDADA